MIQRMTPDRLLMTADAALRTVFAPARCTHPFPSPVDSVAGMSDEDKKRSGALMRVNHVGEVCAQALYAAQALATSDTRLRTHFLTACAEETDHLAWTEQRLATLGSHPSWLNPLWYAGAFAIGLAAGKLGGDRVSLGFVVETERQVEAHLHSHLSRLPDSDTTSRAIVTQMKTDEARHANEAQAAGALDLPGPVKGLMRLAAKVMTTVAHRI